MLDEHVGARAPGERGGAGEHLVGHSAEGIQVGHGGDFGLMGLLGGHVGWGSHEMRHGGEAFVGGCGKDADGSEAEDLEMLHVAPFSGQVGRHDDEVRGLDVAVDQVLGVHGREPGRRLSEEERRASGRHRTFLVDDPGEQLAFEQLEDDEGEAGGAPAEVDDTDDVGMADAAERHRFAPKALEHLSVGPEVAEQDLERVMTVENLVLGLIHDPHGPHPETLSEHVAVQLLSQ